MHIWVKTITYFYEHYHLSLFLERSSQTTEVGVTEVSQYRERLSTEAHDSQARLILDTLERRARSERKL